MFCMKYKLWWLFISTLMLILIMILTLNLIDLNYKSSNIIVQHDTKLNNVATKTDDEIKWANEIKTIQEYNEKKTIMTVDDLKILLKKGHDLTWQDFTIYQCSFPHGRWELVNFYAVDGDLELTITVT